jgi:hypothetical protein
MQGALAIERFTNSAGNTRFQGDNEGLDVSGDYIGEQPRPKCSGSDRSTD